MSSSSYYNTPNHQNVINRVEIKWTSSAAGALTESIKEVNGTILQVEFVPNTTTAQPTDLYDLTLTDEAGFDVLRGLGANLSNTTVTRKTPAVTMTDGADSTLVPVVACGPLTLNITNAGNAKQGTIYLYIR